MITIFYSDEFVFDLAYIFLSLSSIFLFLFVWSRVEAIRPFYILFWSYFLFVILGGFYDGYSRFYSVTDEAKLISLVGFLSILAGGLLARIAFPNSEAIIRKSFYSNQLGFSNSLVLVRLGLVALFIGWAGTGFVYYRMEVIPILSESPQYYRTRTLQGMGLFYHSSRYLIYFSLGLLALLSSCNRFSKLWLVFFIISSSILLFGYAIRMNSAMAFAIPFLLFFCVKFYWDRFVIFYCALFLTGVLFLGGVLQYYRSYEYVKDQGILEFAFDAMLHRPWVQIENVNHLVNGLGSGGAFLMSYYADLTKILPGANLPNGGVVLHDMLGLNFIGGGITPTLAGEAYVNIGWIGVLLVPLIYAFFIEGVYFFLMMVLFLLQ